MSLDPLNSCYQSNNLGEQKNFSYLIMDYVMSQENSDRVPYPVCVSKNFLQVSSKPTCGLNYWLQDISFGVDEYIHLVRFGKYLSSILPRLGT